MYRKALSHFFQRVKKFCHLLLSVLERKFSQATMLQSRFNMRALFSLLVLICVLSGSVIFVRSQWGAIVIGSRGNIRVDEVGVYRDANCSTAVEYLDWGTIEPGSAQNITLFIRNEGNQVATLFLKTENWTPITASNYLSLSWNYDGRMLSPMGVIEVILSLSVSPNIENIVGFSFDVIIGVNG